MRSVIATLLSTMLLWAGCGKKEEGGATPEAKGAGADKKGPAPLEWKKLDKMGLQIEAPADAEVIDMTADAPNVKLSSNDCSIYVSTVTEAYTSEYEKAVAEVEKDPGTKFKKFTKQEKTDTGWHLEFEAEGMIEPKPLYGVQIRTRIGDKAYECGDKAESAEKAQCTIKACKSLKAI
jgi:hypothetical protein